jgi:hypothetical protein
MLYNKLPYQHLIPNRSNGFSYDDIMLKPLAAALGSSLPSDMPIWFALQGEMGATVFRYPKDYQSLLDISRERVEEACSQVGDITLLRRDRHQTISASDVRPEACSMQRVKVGLLTSYLHSINPINMRNSGGGS